MTPEIRFVMDESIERSERVLKLLDQVRGGQRFPSTPGACPHARARRRSRLCVQVVQPCANHALGCGIAGV
jgi:hypothetical protein